MSCYVKLSLRNLPNPSIKSVLDSRGDKNNILLPLENIDDLLQDILLVKAIIIRESDDLSPAIIQTDISVQGKPFCLASDILDR